MNVPKRVQRTRKKGDKLPPNTRCCTRPGFWSNPLIGDDAGKWFRVWLKYLPEASAGNVAKAARSLGYDVHVYYRTWEGHTAQRLFLRRLDELRSYDYLACYCKLSDPDCHVQTILDLLKGE